MKSLAIFFSALFLLTACAPSKERLKAMLMENPEIIFDVIEKHPAKFAQAAQKAANEGRRLAAAKAEADEKASQDAEFKNPKVPEVAADRAIRGNKNAPLTIVEYSDFQCPYCKRGWQVMEEIAKKYGDKVRLVFKHLPLNFHPMALPAAKRFEAIAMQSPEKAYRFHDEVFLTQEKLGPEGEKFLDAVAKKVGANIAKMKTDMESPAVAARIQADTAEASKFGISGTPGFVVGGITLKGAFPAEAFAQVIDRRLAETTRGTASEK